MLQRDFKIGPFYCIQSGLNPLSFRGLLPLWEPTLIYSPFASLATLSLFLIVRAPLHFKKNRFRGPCKNLSTAISQTQYVRFVPKLSIRLNLSLCNRHIFMLKSLFMYPLISNKVTVTVYFAQ